MKKKTLLTFILTGVALSIASSMTFIRNNYVAHADNVLVNDGEYVKDVYHIGETFVPSKDTKISYEGNQYDPTSIYCSYPSGNTKKGLFFPLTEYGKYVITYETKVNNKLITAKQYLVIKKDQYYFATSSSNMRYGELDFSYQNSGYNEGLCLDMTEGDIFYISNPINIYENKVTEIINLKIVQRGEPVVKYMNVRLTDCYDPEIYIDIDLKRGNYEYEQYVQAGFKGSGMVGLEASGSGLINIDNVLYNVDGNGTIFPSSYKTVSESNMTINSLTYTFDNSNPARPRLYGNTDRTYTNKLIREFNNPDVSSSMFPGFTNGNVYLSVSVSSFNGVQTGPVQIASINGKSGKELLPFDFYEDKNAPIINVDVPSLNNNILGGSEIVLPKANVIDDTGVNGTYETSVYYDYDSLDTRKNVSTITKSNGDIAFTANKLGVYTVEYKAKDVYGNESVSLLKLNASSFSKDAFTFTSKLDSNIYAGSNIKLNQYDMVSLNQVNNIYAEITKPNGEKEIVEDLSKPYFVDRSGNYKATYYFEDCFYKGSKEVSFVASNSLKPIFEKDAIPTPYYFMVNGNYALDTYPAYSYGNNGKEMANTKTYVSYNNGEYELLANYDDFSIDSSKVNQTIKFKTVCESEPSVFIESEERLVIDNGYNPGKRIELEQFFQGDFDKVKDNNNSYYTSKQSGHNNLKFVNPLSFANFSFQYLFPKDTSINEFKVSLVDYTDNNSIHTLTFSDVNKVALDNNDPVEMQTSWKNSGEAISMDYSSTNSKLIIDSVSFDLPNDFGSDLVLLSLDFEGLVKDQSVIKVFKVCNQRFTNVTRDTVSPFLIVDFPTTVANIGDTFIVSVPSFSDVLSPSPKKLCTLNVIYNNETVTAKDGTVLRNIENPTKEYEVEVNGYGVYVISYVFFDGANQKTQKQVAIYAYDVVAPTLTLSTRSDTKKASDSIATIAYEVSDNVSSPENITVYFVAYDSRGVFVSSCEAGKTLNIQTKGQYKVYVYAADECGNYTYDYYILTLK